MSRVWHYLYLIERQQHREAIRSWFFAYFIYSVCWYCLYVWFRTLRSLNFRLNALQFWRRLIIYTYHRCLLIFKCVNLNRWIYLNTYLAIFSASASQFLFSFCLRVWGRIPHRLRGNNKELNRGENIRWESPFVGSRSVTICTVHGLGSHCIESDHSSVISLDVLNQRPEWEYGTSGAILRRYYFIWYTLQTLKIFSGVMPSDGITDRI